MKNFDELTREEKLAQVEKRHTRMRAKNLACEHTFDFVRAARQVATLTQNIELMGMLTGEFPCPHQVWIELRTVLHIYESLVHVDDEMRKRALTLFEDLSINAEAHADDAEGPRKVEEV